MDGVTIITGPRTGAGHLFALLRNFEAVAPRDGLFADGVGGAEARIDAAEREAGAAGKSLLALKATSELPIQAIEHVLERPRMHAVFVLRRQIDAYVSLAKATALGAFRDTDLTRVKVKLDVARFALWLDEQEAWYAHWQHALQRRGVPMPILRYETHLSMPPESVLRSFAAAMRQLGIELRVPSALTHPGLVKQDRENAAASRVRNWPDFSRGLIERGIEKRAFGYPL